MQQMSFKIITLNDQIKELSECNERLLKTKAKLQVKVED